MGEKEVSCHFPKDSDSGKRGTCPKVSFLPKKDFLSTLHFLASAGWTSVA